MNKFDVNPPGLVNGVQRKEQPNQTNWQFSDRYSLKKAAPDMLPKQVSIKSKFPPCWLQTCGNCTSNAVLGADAYYYHTDKWIPSTIFTYYNQRKMSHITTKKDIGSCIETALEAVRKYGACNSTVWGNDHSYLDKPSKEAYTDGLHGHEVTKYYRLKNLKEIRKALNLGYPVCISMQWAFKSMDADFIMNTPTKKEAWDTDECHAIVLVGYDDEKGLVEFRNSWGTNWGNDGYAYFTYDAVKNCCLWDDTYAVVK